MPKPLVEIDGQVEAAIGNDSWFGMSLKYLYNGPLLLGTGRALLQNSIYRRHCRAAGISGTLKTRKYYSSQALFQLLCEKPSRT
jgi:hypothetical protein